MPSLAIIIPAYKEEFFDKALNSLAAQCNKNFTVYIGDDCSPYNLKIISDSFKKDINIVYHRFNENLGSKDLVSQWERCVSLKGNEEWIWLFSDDDIAEDRCVDFFYKALEKTNSYYDVYRFNTSVIDAESRFVSESSPSPEYENSIELAHNILLWKRGNSMPDHIFNYTKYLQLGGFVHTKFAQGADWATSINFAYEKGLYTIGGPIVKWRNSGQNVSSTAGASKNELIFGHIQFLHWLSFKFHEGDALRFNFPLDKIIEAIQYNFKSVTEIHYKGLPYKNLFKIIKQLSLVRGITTYTSVKICLQLMYNKEREALRKKVRQRIKLRG